MSLTGVQLIVFIEAFPRSWSVPFLEGQPSLGRSIPGSEGWTYKVRDRPWLRCRTWLEDGNDMEASLWLGALDRVMKVLSSESYLSKLRP